MRNLIKQSLVQQDVSVHQFIPQGALRVGEVNKRPLSCLRPAAVLLPLVEYPTGINVILTQRTEHLRHHAGQVCLPGGTADPQDTGPIATALREAEEEIGLPQHQIEIAGYLDVYETGSGFLVTTVVGFVQPHFDLKLDAFEVADVFEVPLDFILDSANYQAYPGGWGQQNLYLHYQNRLIWGVTAGILINFRDRVQAGFLVNESENSFVSTKLTAETK